MRDNLFVMSVGGSIICPKDINVPFLKKFYQFLKREIARGSRFILIAGGGAPARNFQEAAGSMVHVDDEDKDWLGIHATRLNAHLLRTIFKHYAHPVLLKGRGRVKSFAGHKVIVGAGWHPGSSTDFVAVQTAIDFGATRVINLGHPDYVYNKDHRKYKDAKPFHSLHWDEYLKLIPRRWSPGMHAPVDPVAARLAARENIEVIVAHGTDLKNLRNILREKKFKGTTIS